MIAVLVVVAEEGSVEAVGGERGCRRGSEGVAVVVVVVRSADSAAIGDLR